MKPDPLVPALLPVGKDCDCGHPMIWAHGEQRCAVYGTHPTPVFYRTGPQHPAVTLILAHGKARR